MEEKHTHDHGHYHDPKETKKILNRMSRSIGHFEACKRMYESGVDCADVLIQLAAVRSEINNIGKEILKSHLSHCIVHAVEKGDEDAIKHLNESIDRFMK